jgi:hypothetical protein
MESQQQKDDAKATAAAQDGGDKKLYLDDVTGEMVSKK